MIYRNAHIHLSRIIREHISLPPAGRDVLLFTYNFHRAHVVYIHITCNISEQKYPAAFPAAGIDVLQAKRLNKGRRTDETHLRCIIHRRRPKDESFSIGEMKKKNKYQFYCISSYNNDFLKY